MFQEDNFQPFAWMSFCDTVNVNVQHTLLPRFYGEVRLKGRAAAREQYITQQLLREQ